MGSRWSNSFIDYFFLKRANVKYINQRKLIVIVYILCEMTEIIEIMLSYHTAVGVFVKSVSRATAAVSRHHVIATY